MRRVTLIALAAGALLSTNALGREMVLSGDWAASCVERRDGVGVRVICDRFGGFLSNTYPAGCEGNNVFVCRGRDLCSVAREVSIVENGNPRALQRGIEKCPGPVRGPAR